MGIDFQDIVPYTCVFIDATWSDFMTAASHALLANSDEKKITEAIQKLWTHEKNPNPAIPCLSVRSALDLYLRVKNFPPGSEIIMSAINIPDMVHVVRHHGLKVVPVDVDIETCAPKAEVLQHLITEKTVAILVAHIYGKGFDMEPFIQAAAKHKLCIIEDCAETFCGFEHIGHPKADISLFSFGAIKFITAFGGAIAKVSDPAVYNAMVDLQNTYTSQTRGDYLNRVMKYSIVWGLLNCPSVVKPGMYLTRSLGIDHKKHVVKMLRGFPSNLIERIRQRPSTPLLTMMLQRMKTYHASEMTMTKVKGDYVSERLMDNVTRVGNKAEIKNYWLFPIVVENADEVYKALNAIGIDAYRGATQLNIIEPENSPLSHLETFVTHYPHEAKFLIDHVVYLPVNKTVPFQELDRIISALEVAMKATNGRLLLPLARSHMPKITSKL